MRDPNRIYTFCNELAGVWRKQCPDWRFGQLMLNVLGAYVSEEKRDPFFLEEEQFMAYMKKYLHYDE